MLEALTRRGCPLGMITNGRSPFHEVNIRALGIESFFSVILVSGAGGVKNFPNIIFIYYLFNI